MRRLVGFIFGAAFLTSTLSACSWDKKGQDINGDRVKVQIPFSVDGTYRLEIIELFSLQNINRLEGLAARFFVNPDAISGRIKGRNPSLRYIRDSDDVIIPTDDLSLQLLTIYAHFEKLRDLDVQTGAKDTISYPRHIAVNAQIPAGPDGNVTDNALYSSKFDSLLMVPFTQPSLPLMANGGVIAHEHFHSLFQKIVIEGVGSKFPAGEESTLHDIDLLVQKMGMQIPMNFERADRSRQTSVRDQYHVALLQGVNEGLADVWGWVYSGDDSFVGRSLPQEKQRRDISAPPPQRLFPREIFKDAISSGMNRDQLLAMSYLHGTQLARTIRHFANEYSINRKVPMSSVRLMVGQMIIGLLPSLAKDFSTMKDEELLTLSRVVFLFSKQVKDIRFEECNRLAKLMPADDREETNMPEICRDLDPKGNHASTDDHTNREVESQDR